jgi:hypothetical protein
VGAEMDAEKPSNLRVGLLRCAGPVPGAEGAS